MAAALTFSLNFFFLINYSMSIPYEYEYRS